MIKLVVTNEKNLELYELEKVHVGENKFGYYLIFLPEVLNGYNLSDCEVKLVQIFEDNTSVAIDVDTTQEMRPIKEFITLDATAQAQTVTLSVLITHNGDVIGKTNQKTYQVYPTKNATPIDPREELDEIIAELRADKAELETTVSEQAVEIAEKTAQITELSNQVEDLTEETTEQAATITRQNETITELNERRIPVYIQPSLQSKLATPSWQSQYIEPDSDKDGLSSVTINPITAELIPNLEPHNIAKNVIVGGIVGTFDSFPENPVGGIYFYEPDENDNPTKCKIYNWKSNPASSLFENVFQNSNQASFPYLEEVDFIDCESVTHLGGVLFRSYHLLSKVVLPNKLEFMDEKCFYDCTLLKEISLPNTLTALYFNTFCNCVSLERINIPKSITVIRTNAFNGCIGLKYVEIETGFNGNTLNLSASTLYSHGTILSWFNALADRTGETAYTLTIGTTNLNKMTAEEKAIAINKNWNLA